MNVKLLLYSLLILVFPSAYADSFVDKGFKKIESLIGHWHGTLPDGNPINISYQALNGGAILEVYHSEDPMWWNMSTVYYKDNDQILMNHYCSWGNHPKLGAHIKPEKIGTSDLRSGKLENFNMEVETLDFTFINLVRTQSQNGYMHHLKFIFLDNNHLTHQWTWRENNTDTALKLTLVRNKIYD